MLSNSPVVNAYRERTPGSAAASTRARAVFPSGLTHDSRRLEPYPPYVTHARGARKWDVDGNEYVDYYGGHGALLLGHCHPAMTEAVQAQVARGTHFGACHELEVRWGELVQQLVPSAERVRFHSSGTEANLMALRLARAFTGRSKIVRFRGHFHGWQDHAAFGVDNHLDGSASPGVLAGIAENVLLAPADDIEAACDLIRSRDDIAAVMLEPTGGYFGQVPMPRAFVHRLREVTSETGALLVFDEVVTGFRVAPGGVEELYGIRPDLSSWAKILAGGLPGGCITGRADVLDLLDFEQSKAQGREKVSHYGTFNANPLSAVAGISILELIAAGGVCEKASANGERLRALCNAVLSEEGVPWAAYGEHSGIYFHLNPEGHDIDPLDFDPLALPDYVDRLTAPSPLAHRLRLGLLANGVDMTGKPGGTLSAVHEEEDLQATAEALRRAVRLIRQEGLV
ncbi:MAG: aminotransferase class III-fold pyridoxal phosphate-dependent enzyme [Burkholderiales bacterium]|nr:aminotransferase class III-fold pyridoxal phosphate-dependent enzyme [Burkholderiales bacterium]